MKQIYTICLLTILALCSCEKAVVHTDLSAIVGDWFQDAGPMSTPGLSYRSQIIFRQDGTYERSLVVVKTDDVHEIVGYMNLITGDYQINNNGTISRYNTEQYGLDNVNQYLDRTELVFEAATHELPKLGARLDESGNLLTLDFAGTNDALCVAFETFRRSN